ncbi:MAG: phage terminase small subunit P27 family [Caulobacteraceae bacterium]|nr:phage terminase small subunit P27 family [Caulobacteraceae bacterium]
MARGPKPKIARATMPVESELPTPPAWLEGEALKKWGEVVERLKVLGTLGRADTTAIVRYCQQWSQWVDCQAILKIAGMTMEQDMQGQGTITKVRPEVKIANDLAVQMKRFEDAMGMNAGSRNGMGIVPEKPKAANPFEALRKKIGS